MMTSEDLRFFMVIADNKSLAAAARALNVTPPTVTQRLQGIEAKLGIKLVDRRARTATLTDEGELLAERAIEIIQEMTDLEESLTSRTTQVSGRLKILAPIGFGNNYVAPLVADFHRRFPQITVELELSDNPNFSQGSAWDLMIYIGELVDSSLKMVTLAPNQRFLCASPDYIAQVGSPKTPSDLRHHCCIALRENEEDVTMWRFTNRETGVLDSVRIHPKFVCNEGRAVKQWAVDGHGIIMRSEWDMTPELNRGELVRLLTDYDLPRADIVALMGSDQRSRSARTVMFLEELKSILSNQPWHHPNSQSPLIRSGLESDN